MLLRTLLETQEERFIVAVPAGLRILSTKEEQEKGNIPPATAPLVVAASGLLP